MRVAVAWSSQNPGAPIVSSSSVRRRARPSGSKVITDPGELGPDLLETLVERLAVNLGHAAMVPGPPAGGPVPACHPPRQLRRLEVGAEAVDIARELLVRAREMQHRQRIGGEVEDDVPSVQ